MFPERSEELIAIYKSLIETDNWEFFCDGAGYLAKYDREFIMPYIERFANDEFDASELQSLRAALIKRKVYSRCVQKTADRIVESLC